MLTRIYRDKAALSPGRRRCSTTGTATTVTSCCGLPCGWGTAGGCGPYWPTGLLLNLRSLCVEHGLSDHERSPSLPPQPLLSQHTYQPSSSSASDGGGSTRNITRLVPSGHLPQIVPGWPLLASLSSCSLRWRTPCATSRYCRSRLVVCRPEPINTPIQSNTVMANSKKRVLVIAPNGLCRHARPFRCHG